MSHGILARLLWASPFLAVGTWLIVAALRGSGIRTFSDVDVVAVLQMGWAVLFLGVAASLLAPGVVGRLPGLESILLPGQRFNKPQAMLGPAETLARAGKFPEALEKFEAITRSHPEEVRGWEARIHIHAHELHDVERARAAMAEARKAPLRKEELAYLESMTRSLEREESRPAPGSRIPFRTRGQMPVVAADTEGQSDGG